MHKSVCSRSSFILQYFLRDHRHHTTPPKYVQDNLFLETVILSEHTSAPYQQGAPMPYPVAHRPAVKKTIIDSARKLFNRHGFENVSIQQIMAGAGLTHGGFYSYFNSKSDLYAEVLTCFFTDPNWKSCWEGVKVDLSSRRRPPSRPRLSFPPAF